MSWWRNRLSIWKKIIRHSRTPIWAYLTWTKVSVSITTMAALTTLSTTTSRRTVSKMRRTSATTRLMSISMSRKTRRSQTLRTCNPSKSKKTTISATPPLSLMSCLARSTSSSKFWTVRIRTSASWWRYRVTKASTATQAAILPSFNNWISSQATFKTLEISISQETIAATERFSRLLSLWRSD